MSLLLYPKFNRKVKNKPPNHRRLINRRTTKCLEETIQQAVTETRTPILQQILIFGDLFTESTPEEATEASKSVSEPQEVAKENTPAPVEEQKVVEADVKPNAEQTIKVKYNGKEQEIPISEAITLTQKGMNYEHVKSELDALKNAKEFSIIDKFAKANNMSREDYVAFAGKTSGTDGAATVPKRRHERRTGKASR